MAQPNYLGHPMPQQAQRNQVRPQLFIPGSGGAGAHYSSSTDGPKASKLNGRFWQIVALIALVMAFAALVISSIAWANSGGSPKGQESVKTNLEELSSARSTDEVLLRKLTARVDDNNSTMQALKDQLKALKDLSETHTGSIQQLSNSVAAQGESIKDFQSFIEAFGGQLGQNGYVKIPLPNNRFSTIQWGRYLSTSDNDQVFNLPTPRDTNTQCTLMTSHMIGTEYIQGFYARSCDQYTFTINRADGVSGSTYFNFIVVG